MAVAVLNVIATKERETLRPKKVVTPDLTSRRMADRHPADGCAEGNVMNVKFDVSQLDSAVRAAQDFQPCLALQGAGLLLSRLKNDGAQRAISIAKSVIGDPSIDPADRVAALTWLETHSRD